MQPIHNPDDKVFKSLFQSKRTFLQLLRHFIAMDWTKQIDEQSLENINNTFILPGFEEREADIVYKCRFHGHDVIFYVLLELQSTVDQEMPWRLLNYMMEIWRSHQRDIGSQTRKSTDYRLPPIVPIVVYNGIVCWTAQTCFRKYLDKRSLFGDSIMDFCYYLIDIKRLHEKDLAELTGILSLVFKLENAKGLESLLPVL